MIIKEETTKDNLKICIQDGADWEYTFRAIDLDSGLYVEITHCRTIQAAEKRYNKYITSNEKSPCPDFVPRAVCADKNKQIRCDDKSCLI